MLPEMVDRDFTQVSRELAALGITVNMQEEVYNSDIAQGNIIDATYNEGEYVEEGTIVNVSVSRGTQIVTVPQFTSNSLEEAEEIIAEQGDVLILQEEYTSHVTFDAGVIFDQSPKPGDRVAAGSIVTIFISTGLENEEFRMPGLIGMPLDEALVIIEELGLLLGDVDERNSNSHPEGAVISQTISENRLTLPGHTINLSVSLGPAPTESPEITPIPEGSTADQTVPPGIPERTPEPPVETPEPTETVYTPTPEPYVPPVPTPSPEPYVPRIPTPSPTPIILPTPSPTPESQPYQPPLMPEDVEKIITLDHLNGNDYANVYISQTGTGMAIYTIYEGRLTLDDLPYEIPVKGRGTKTYNVYYNGQMGQKITVNFDE